MDTNTPTTHNTPISNTVGLGILCGIGNSITLVLIAALVKMASDYHNPVDIFFYRSITVLALSLGAVVATGQLKNIRKTNHKLQIIRATIGAVCMLLAFTSYSLLPLAQAQIFFFLSPLLVVLLSYPLLKEKVGIYRMSAVFIGLCGALIVLQPGAIASMTGAMVGIGVTICYTFVMLCLRLMGKTESPEITVFYFSIVSVALILPAIPFYASIPSIYSLTLMLSAGFFAFITQFCMTYAYKFAPASVISPLIYLNLIWALMLDYMFWQKVPNVMMMTGAFIIVASNLFVLWREHKNAQK
ncbi:MAG: DMT family transporter [Alphaproteobacteria bacterium]